MITLDISSWWQTLTLLQQIYWCIAFPFSILFVLQLIMTFIGGDIHTGLDHDGIGVHEFGDASFHFFTIKNLIGFFTIFSWTGLACSYGGMLLLPTLLISTLCGLIMMFIMAGLFYFIARMNQSGTLEMNNAIGKIGEVYLKIPARRNGKGKVEIKIQGAFRYLDAVTEEIEDLKIGTMVEVLEVINDNILVVKRNR